MLYFIRTHTNKYKVYQSLTIVNQLEKQIRKIEVLISRVEACIMHFRNNQST